MKRPRDRARRGTTAVEMALVAPAFFLFLVGSTEMSLIFTAQQLLDNAAYNASRLGKTGYVATGDSQLGEITNALDNELSSFGSMIDTSKITLNEVAYSSFSNSGSGTGGANGFGNAQQIVVYQISYPWKLFTPLIGDIIGTNGVLNLSTQIVVRNEPYG